MHTMKDDPHNHPCEGPVGGINEALAEVLGKPFPPPPDLKALMKEMKTQS
jgi:hypothetical protein